MLLALGDSSARALAQRAWQADIAFDEPRAIALYTRAVRADPADLGNLMTLRAHLTDRAGGYAGAREFETIVAGTPLAPCFAAQTARDYKRLQQLRTNPVAARCAALSLLGTPLSSEADIAILARAVADKTISMAEVSALSAALEARGRRADVEKLLRAAAEIFNTERDQFDLTQLTSTLLRGHGRRADAERAMRRVGAAVLRSNTPMLRYKYIEERARWITGSAQVQAYREAAAIATAHGAFEYCADVLLRLVHSRIDNGEMSDAMAVAPQAVSCADRSGQLYWRATARISYGRALAKAGRNADARTVLQQALTFADQTGSPYDIADAWHNLAHTYEAAGMWPQARHAVAQFTKYADKLSGDPIDIVSLRDAGIIFWDSGDRATAQSYFDRMVALIREGHHESQWAGEYYERIGDLASARTFYRKALREGGDSARVSAGLTRIYLALGVLDSAASMARIHDAATLTPEEVLLQPRVALLQGRAQAALQSARAFAQQQVRQNNQQGAANAYLEVAEIAIAQHDSATARAAAARADAIARKARFESEAIRALTLLGRASSDAQSTRLLQQAAAKARSQHLPLLNADAWQAITERRLAASQSRDALAAMDSALRARRTTRDKFEDAFDRVRYAQRVAEQLDLGAWQAVRQRNAELLYEWETRRKVNRAPLHSLSELRSRMPAGHLLVDYTVTDSGAAALVVTRSRAVVVPLAVSSATLQELVARVRAPTQAAFGRMDLTRARFDEKASAALYDAVVAPVAAYAQHDTIWQISPDAMLHLVPFDALARTDGATREFLIDRVVTSYVQSPDAIVSDVPVQLNSLTVIADRTPGMSAELRAIQAQVPRSDVIANATEAQVRKVVANADALHFTVHAEANAELPLSSYLLLRAGNGEDGLYHVAEIARDRPHARLVVLSACATVSGQVFRGGPFSIANAFAHGGSTTVVATQWPVGADAAQFAATFYARLRAGASIPGAARSAKLAMKKQGASPLAWAPFVVVNGSGF